MSDINLEEYIIPFIKAVKNICVQTGSIPCAFAIMFVEPGPRDKLLFKIRTEAVQQLLPKGDEEVQQFLRRALEMWAKKNQPLTDLEGVVELSRSIH